jgi:hypothetical protein
MLNEELYQELFVLTKEQLSRGAAMDSIEDYLRDRTDDAVLITVVLKEARKEHHAVLQKEGLQKIGIGIAFVASGFLITLLNFHSNKSFDYALFGFTSVGISFIFWGLFKIIG